MIDLHSHTKASDGEMSSEELIDLAISRNITALAITDHDTIDGLESAEEYAKGKNILLIPGIEMEAAIDKGQMHILGLFVNYKDKAFLEKLDYIKNARNSRNSKFIEELNKMGYEITLDELKEVSSGKTIGKPHFARVFLRKHYIETKSEMFDRFFNQPPLNTFKKSSYTPKDVITMLKDAGSIVVLAHPQTLKLEGDELVDKIKELKSYGLDGLECYHSKQTYEQMKRYREIACELNLLITKGSDYHGPIVKPETELGTGNNYNIVSDEENTILANLLRFSNTKI